jgi:hypothetical protein
MCKIAQCDMFFAHFFAFAGKTDENVPICQKSSPGIDRITTAICSYI